MLVPVVPLPEDSFQNFNFYAKKVRTVSRLKHISVVFTSHFKSREIFKYKVRLSGGPWSTKSPTMLCFKAFFEHFC